MHHQPGLINHIRLILAVIICAGLIGGPVAVSAQDQPPTTGTPIVPSKPKAEVKFEIVRHYTVPQQPRMLEPFELHLEIMNRGTAPAVDWFVKNANCTPQKDDAVISDGPCAVPLPNIENGQSTSVFLRLRSFHKLATDTQKEAFLTVVLNLEPPQGSGLTAQPLNAALYFLAAPAIVDKQPTLERPFQGPDITVARTWTAKARSTVEELMTPVPLRIDMLPITSGVPGGPEFELVVELVNQGPVEAANIFIDFCAPSGRFNPVGSTCRKFVPANLPPGGKAVASQTLAYNNTATPMPGRGEKVTLTITYQFWYANQRLQGTARPDIYLYPQEYPAVVPPQRPYVIVNTQVLNIRLGPGTNYPLVGQAHGNEQFDIIGKSSNADWWQINFRGRAAWVAAYYVTASGGENVATVTPPPIPPVAPPPPPEPTRTPNPSPVAMQQNPVSPALVNVVPLPTVGLETYQETRLDTRGLVLANQSTTLQETIALDVLMTGPWVVVEYYRSEPEQIVDDQPFTLELVLRNAGQATARHLALGWRSDEVVPFGAGNIRALDDLTPGSVSIVSGQFLLTDSGRATLLQVPVELLYSDEGGQLRTHTEELALLRAAPDQLMAMQGAPIPAANATAPAAQNGIQPLWLRVLLGLLGLGAGQ